MTESANAFRDFEHRGWQKVAAQYEPSFGALTMQSIGPLLEAVGCGTGTRLLDAACGPGHLAAAAAGLGCLVIGVDFSSEMIAMAKRKHPHMDFREGDVEGLKFADGTFDAVVMNFGMLHLARPEQAMAEARRVLRPGGRYAFTVWDTPDRAMGFGVVLRAIQAHGNVNVPLPAGPPFFRFSDPAESTKALGEAGFADVRVVQVPQIWRMESADVLFDTMRNAAVRTAALLNMQTASALTAIQNDIASQLEQYRTQDAIVLPMPAILTSAVRPA